MKLWVEKPAARRRPRRPQYPVNPEEVPESGNDELWQRVLNRVESVASEDGAVLDLTDLPGVSRYSLENPGLLALVDRLMAQVS